MVNKMSLQESILNAVNTIVEQRTNELKVDKTITAIIEKNMGVFNGKTLYKVSYEGGFFEAITLNAEEVYSPNTPVYILIPQGNFSKEKVIIGRANNINLENESNTVISTMNQYCLVGSNLLYNAKKDDNELYSNLQYGVHSYHNPIEEEEKSDSIFHRYNQICSYNLENNNYEENFERCETSINKIIYNQNLAFNEEDLNILKEEATGLMLKADFKTNLTREQRQQAQGEYGLILNLVFNNLNKDYGSTNGEVFEKISDIIVGEIYISSEQARNFNGIKSIRSGNATNTSYDYYSVKLKDIHDYYINQILNNEEGIKNNIRLLIEYTNNLKTTFSTNNSTKILYTNIVDNTLTAYLSFLNELELCNNIENFNRIYNSWWNQVIGDTEDKIISYKFSSNNMIGNPLSFNQWNTQYQILNVDIKNLIRINSIILYKQGFIEDETKESSWPLNNSGPDIFVKNLQLYPIKPLEGENGDYSLKVQPKNLDNNSNILMGTDATDTVVFEAIFMRKMLENLSANTKVSYSWFKQDFSITDTNSADYNAIAGLGWKIISNAKSSNFITNGTNNLAYKNNYKCIVQYAETENNTIILETTFTVYNKSVGTDIFLESDLGTTFSFDAGKPEIICKINEDLNNSDELEDYKEIPFEIENGLLKYEYYWIITDAANGNKIFLNKIYNDSNGSLNESNNIITYNTAEHIIDKIEFYKLVKINDNYLEKVKTENPKEATRISYPVNKLSSGFVVECSVKKKMSSNLSSDVRYVDAGSASLEFLNKGLDIDLNSFKLIIENGTQVFQYDEYGNAPNNICKKEPLNILPLHAKVLAPSGVEIKNSNYSVEWIFPTESTMIIAEETLETNPLTQLPQLYKGSNCKFDINPLYNSDYWNNQITCHVKYNNQDLYKDTEFTFTKIGENGTNGTDVVAKIYYTGNDLLNTLHSEPLTIYIQNEKVENEIISKAMFNVSNGYGRIKTLSEILPIIGDNGILNVSLYQKGQMLSSDNYASTYPRWNLLGNSSYSKNYGKYFNITNENEKKEKIDYYNINWDASYNPTTKKENELLYQIIQAEVQLKTGQTYYATYNLPFIWYTENSEPITQISHCIAIDKNSYLSSILYNADGRNPIYNHNQGLKFINIPSNVTKIKWQAKTEKQAKIEDDKKPACFDFILESENNSSLTKIIEKTENIKSEEMVYILPNDVYDGGITNNYIEATFYNEENEIIVIACVPIYMSLNTFGLASLNAWDGNHVTVNEDEGYIMSPQIGAGEKDENNRFTGILMGKTEGEVGHTGEDDPQTGLFGYSHGVQSIFLDAKTGNAIFGLPNGLHLDSEGNLEEKNNFNEGRIELRPGGESIIGGWTLGNKSIYYTNKKVGEAWVHSGELEKRTLYDYIPNWKTGLIEKDLNQRYFKHHEKDIKYDQSGILLYAGESPYISIKGRPFTEEDIPKIINEEKESFIKPNDSIELQLDPATPTLFTIFRHNGGEREGIEGSVYNQNENYEKGSRTFLAGINSKGEFIANGLKNTNVADISVGNDTWKAGSLVTKFAVNALNAFGDFIYVPARSSHIGFEITANRENTLAHFFTKINGLNVIAEREIDDNYDPTLHISGGYTDSAGEYSRPLALHGENIQIYAKDGQFNNNLNFYKYQSQTDTSLKISTDEVNLQLGPVTEFNLYRDSSTISNNLMTMDSLKINVGKEVSQQYIVEEVKIDNEWRSLDAILTEQKFKAFEPKVCFIDDPNNESMVVRSNKKYYINLNLMKIYFSNWKEISPTYAIFQENVTKKWRRISSEDITSFYYKNSNDNNSYILVNSYKDDNNIFYRTDNSNIEEEDRIIDKQRIFTVINNSYTRILSDQNITKNEETLKSYFVEVSKTTAEKEKEEKGYISITDLNKNLYYSPNAEKENLTQIEDIKNTYQQRWDENNTTIYLNSNILNNEQSEQPFIIIPVDTGRRIEDQHFYLNKFNGFYFQLNIRDNLYYVPSFSLEIEDQNGIIESFEFNAASISNNSTSTSNNSWIRSYYDVNVQDLSKKYYIRPIFENNKRPEDGAERFKINGMFMVDSSPTSQEEIRKLNIYTKYITDENEEKYVLKQYVDSANFYCYYYDNNYTRYYSNSIKENNNNKLYYKCKDEKERFVEITTEGQLYFRVQEEYFKLNKDDIDNINNQENLYKYVSNTQQYSRITKEELNNSEISYYQYETGIKAADKKWITLWEWLGKNLNKFEEYCLDVNEEYKKKTSFNSKSYYIRLGTTYTLFNFNYNYARFQDNKSDNYFYVRKDEFNNIYQNNANKWLFYGDETTPPINIGDKGWKSNKFNDNDIKENKNTLLRQRIISKDYSQEKFEIYSGTYKNYIQKESDFTNIDIDNNIQIKNTRLINFFTNQGINIYYLNTENSGILNAQSSNSFSKKFCLNNSDGIYLISMYNDKQYGFILDNQCENLILESSSNNNIISGNKINIETTATGSGSIYDKFSPQIKLQAGEWITDDKTTTPQLILNSSNNRWATNLKNNNKDNQIYPIFQVKTQFGKIGIFPRYLHADSYSEYFSVNMDQVIVKGLQIQGKYGDSEKGLIVNNSIEASKFIGTQKDSFFDFTGEKRLFGNSSDITISGVGAQGSFKIPKIDINKNNGRPNIQESSITIKIPDSWAIWSALQNNSSFIDYMSKFLTKTDAEYKYASKNHTHDQYATWGHTHSEYLTKTKAENTYAFKDHTHGQYVTSISSGVNSITYYTGNGGSRTVSIPIAVTSSTGSTT